MLNQQLHPPFRVPEGNYTLGIFAVPIQIYYALTLEQHGALVNSS